jgi:glycosyltransferase involved in cell wall biosynthesis
MAKEVSKIKIIRVIARLNVGGPAIHTVLLAKQLNSERFETILITGTEGIGEGSMRAWAEAQGVRPLIIPELGREINLVADLKVLFALYRLFRQERPDIVDTHTAKAGFVGRLAAWLAGTPVVVHTFHGHIFHSYFSPLKTRLFILIEQILAHLSTRIITISPRQRQEILNFGIASPHKILIIPLGFDLEPFLSCESQRGQLRRELSLSVETKLVGIVARLTGIKNHQLFFEAASLIHQHCQNVHFVVVGDGELRAKLEQKVADLNLGQVVHFLGWRQDLPIIYADLDLVMLTSLNEGTPTTLIEAQAAGCPVVATTVGGVPDIVIDGETGYLVPPNNAGALAQAALTILEGNPQVMGQAGRRLVQEKFTAQRLARDMEILYTQLCRK